MSRYFDHFSGLSIKVEKVERMVSSVNERKEAIDRKKARPRYIWADVDATAAVSRIMEKSEFRVLLKHCFLIENK